MTDGKMNSRTNGLPGLSPDDAVWLESMLAGRSPREIARMKSALEALFARPPRPRSGPDLPDPARQALLDITDDLGHLRALFIALDMALADVQDGDSRNALRTLSDTILTRLQAIREDIEDLRTPQPLAA